MSNSSDTEDWVAGLALLFLGFLGLALLTSSSKPKCPVCNNPVEPNTRICPHCGAYLEWGKT